MVLLGLGLFVSGVLSGVTALYWGCVAACVLAAVLLVVARRRIATATAPAESAPAGGKAAGTGATPDAEATAPEAATPEPEAPAQELADPEVEDVEVTDLLMVVDLKDEVFVIDEHPRYHLAGCLHLRARTPIPLPLDEARADGFTPCAVCAPDRNLAEQVRARKAAGKG